CVADEIAFVFSSSVYWFSFCLFFFFFFQAEDGIRDFHVTGVQTCALPISSGPVGQTNARISAWHRHVGPARERSGVNLVDSSARSEERRVGKECRSRWSPYY